MSDLISRSALKEEIAKWLKPTGRPDETDFVALNDIAISVYKTIEEQPTAYDVDAVVEELKKKREESRGLIGKPHMDYGTLCGWDGALFYAIDIVRKGGV